AMIAACGPGAKPAPAVAPPIAAAPAAARLAAAPPKDPAPPVLRLPSVARPIKHAVELTIDPVSEDFTGTITTELEITAPASVLWLDGKEITVDDAAFAIAGARVAARAIYGEPSFVGLVPARPLAPGRATLTIKYRGKMHRNDGDGIYTAQEGNEWYAFTQFEATDARQAFPCFDEPSYKVPWRIAIRTARPLVAIGNTPIESETDEPNGMKLVRFRETPPLPSYLVAFAVGPFEAVDAGKTRAGAPIRIVMPRGHTREAVSAAEATKPLLDRLEDYFGMPYPYAKLDMLAVPVFNAGAMENPGLITYRQDILLTKPEEITLASQRRYAEVAAHEMAHQWFGDYVTLAWWDDTWLNESFASWMESKLVEQWKPGWEVSSERASNKRFVMASDSLDTARAIRQPITTANDISNAFDGITYGKGQAVLTMAERTIGPEVFQRGVRDYLATHAWSNATYEDFVGAMSRAAGHDLHPLFDSFVLQSGLPRVSFALSCAPGKPPVLALAQRRYAPTGSKIDPRRTWNVPICVRWGAGGTTGRDCTVLSSETGELALSAKTCPAWVMPNEAGVGYYRMAPDHKLLTPLLASASKALTLPERVTLIGEVNALVSSGEVQKAVALELVESLAKDRSRYIADASIAVVASIDEMVPAALRPNYERFIRRLYQARAHELTWLPRKGEDDNTRQLRTSLLPLVADTGRDPQLIQQATALAWKWLDSHKAVDPEVVSAVLRVAARNGDQKLLERLHADARATSDRAERTQLLAAMGNFVDPKLAAQALAITVTDEFEIREVGGIVQGALAEPRTRELGFAFIKDHFDALLARLPELYRPYLAFSFVPLCDDARRPEIEQVFAPRIEKLDGGPRLMAQALEEMSLCSAQRKAERPGVEAFLKRQ
ncbi:MAG TPA: M1 family metallopeptidase, partial [Kofleriaceae bacterium]|nr:M1 family metallopeptidase [Kofleriaceae bacterium]